MGRILRKCKLRGSSRVTSRYPMGPRTFRRDLIGKIRQKSGKIRVGRAQNLSLPPLTSPLPLGAGESASMSSGSNPLQSEDNSIIHPNFAAVLNVAKPVAQLDAHSVSSTSK